MMLFFTWFPVSGMRNKTVCMMESRYRCDYRAVTNVECILTNANLQSPISNSHPPSSYVHPPSTPQPPIPKNLLCITPKYLSFVPISSMPHSPTSSLHPPISIPKPLDPGLQRLTPNLCPPTSIVRPLTSITPYLAFARNKESHCTPN